MIEIPESIVIAEQINEAIRGKRIKNVIADHSPHKFAWYHGDPHAYYDLLAGKEICKATGFGALVEIKVEDSVILYGDGVRLRLCGQDEKRPKKHQLLIEFDDLSALCASIQMYGGLWCFRKGEFTNNYFLQAKEKPLPLSKKFDWVYFEGIISAPDALRKSVKALLATKQRIPGLGNGVLQDILFNAKIHPRRKVNTLTIEEKKNLFKSIKSTLAEMIYKGGRDTEVDLYSCPGGYKTKLSKKTSGKPCCECNTEIKKEAYMGGSVYYCPMCQKL